METDFEELDLKSLQGAGIFATAAIRAKRCQKCNTIYFVNDNDWTLSRDCRKSDKIEIKETELIEEADKIEP